MAQLIDRAQQPLAPDALRARDQYLCVRQLAVGQFFFSSRRRHTRFSRDWSSDVCSPIYSGEQSAPTDMAAFLEELKTDADRHGHRSSIAFHGHPIVTVRPAAFKRCVGNLVSNAARHGSSIAITGHRDHRWLTVTVDDDGPGIAPHLREEVFKPFLRLDDARNQDEGGTGLGLAIARDIARSNGGDIMLSDSPLGGLRATVRVPI